MNVGGPARHVIWLCEGMQDSEFESRLVTGAVCDGEIDMVQEARDAAIAVTFVGEMSRALSWRDVLVIGRLVAICRAFQPDVIETHTSKAGMTGRVAGVIYRLLARRPCRLVHTYHGFVFRGFYGRSMSSAIVLIERLLARITDSLIVLSERQLSDLRDVYRIGREDQYRVIPLGLDVDSVLQPPERSLRDELAIPGRVLVTGIVGRLTEVKNHALFLDVVASFDDQSATFLVIGEGQLREQLEARAAALGVTGRVRFLGNRSDREVFYAALDLLIVTSISEGTPMAILEAMAAGVPVLSSAVGGVPDLLGPVETTVDGVSIAERGVLVPSGDRDAFVRALSLLHGDAALRARLVKRGRTFVRDGFGKERLVRDMRSLYQELVS
jgi:glycosyltransferase involved in cell wall biosynthesis